MPTIEELRAQLREAEAAAQKLGEVEYEAVRKAATYEWKMEAQPFGFRVSCRYDEKSREAVAAWKEAFPKHGTTNFRDPAQWHGMSYILGYTKAGEPFLHSGGGSIILNLDRKFTGFDPVKITKAQAAQFESGIVPEELKKPW